MNFYQIWTILIGLGFLALTLRTRQFTFHLKSLKDIAIDPHRSLWPKVSLVVPACNEEKTIGTAAKSLLKIDYPNLEIIFVNDRSTDSTGPIIENLIQGDPRAKVIHVKTLPEGWLGKINALNEGIKASTGEWVLISDADVHYSPTALKKAVIHCESDQVEFLTVIPGVRSKGFALAVVMAQVFHQGSLFLNLKKINDPKCRAAFGGGSFNMMKKSTYDRSEGLQWMRMEVIDDTGIALLMRQTGAKMGVLAGKHEIRIEWYPSLRSFARGLEKNAFSLCQYSVWPLLGFVVSMLFIYLGIFMAPFLSDSWFYPAYILVCMLIYLTAVRTQLHKMQFITTVRVLFLPVASMCLPLLFLRASILTIFRGGIRWRDTFYTLDELKKNQKLKFFKTFL